MAPGGPGRTRADPGGPGRTRADPGAPGRTRRLFVSGWTGALGGIPSGSTVLAPGRCTNALRKRESVLLLGPGALSVLDPARMERKLRSSTCICIVVSTSSDLDALTRWRYVGKVPVCTPDRLPARLEEALATPVRREISRSAWAPTGEGPEAERLLGVIPRLSTPRPGEWARTLCLKRHELANLCRKAFGSPPREILRDYRRTYAGLGREAGYTWPRLALEAGYPTEMSFKRSIR